MVGVVGIVLGSRVGDDDGNLPTPRHRPICAQRKGGEHKDGIRSVNTDISMKGGLIN
jgi:hypothetical protein